MSDASRFGRNQRVADQLAELIVNVLEKSWNNPSTGAYQKA